jgi:hypothetical protein
MANEFKHKDPGSALTQAEFIASDGTGHIFESQAAGDVLYASSTTVLARLAKATDGNVLELASGLPAWTASPTIGSTSWANANHAHAASNSGGTLTTLGTVTTGVWQGTAIASGYIAADAITGAKIADDAVDSEHYTDGSIDNAHLADDAVDSDEIAAGAIDTAHIADNQVTVAKIEDIARGSIIYGNASAASAELTKGSANYVLTSDGTDIAWAAAGSGAVTRHGGTTSEATMTATSADDLISIGSLNIPATSPLEYWVNCRKTGEQAVACAAGLKLNSTVAGEAVTSESRTWRSGANAAASQGGAIGFYGSRITAYTASGYGLSTASQTQLTEISKPYNSNHADTAAISTFIIRGISGHSSVTMAADELHIYAKATS